jgi:hypothetical protein
VEQSREQALAPLPVLPQQDVAERLRAASALLSRRLLCLPCLSRLEPPQLLRPQPDLESVCELFPQPKDQSSWSEFFSR